MITGTVQTSPHRLDPLAAQNTEYNHKRMKKVLKVPARYLVEVLEVVVLTEQFLAHDGEDEDDDGENEAEVTERAHRPSDDADEQVQCRPRLGQLEYSELQRVRYLWSFVRSSRRRDLRKWKKASGNRFVFEIGLDEPYFTT